eukprot:3607738-Heterocapsa_arctica.AAC.1
MAAYLKLQADGSSGKRNLKVLPASYGGMTIAHFLLIFSYVVLARLLDVHQRPSWTTTLFVQSLVFLVVVVVIT